jgi:hypothetical protein
MLRHHLLISKLADLLLKIIDPFVSFHQANLQLLKELFLHKHLA